MTTSEPTLRRLDELCDRTPTPAVRLLRREFVGAEAGSAERFEEDSPLERLQRAGFLLTLGQPAAARNLLAGSTGTVPLGLAGAWQQFQDSLEADDGQGGVGGVPPLEGSPVPSLGLDIWLTRVQAWRRTVGV